MDVNLVCAIDDESNRVTTCLSEVAKRVELMRDQAIALQKEKESLLELLQHLQDGVSHGQLTEAVQEDVDWQTERLIVRCLTVEVTVLTPRNEIQEEAFRSVSEIIAKLEADLDMDPYTHRPTVISYLNASLPEPLDGNVNVRFQGKLLSCTLDDQKHFRKLLQGMMETINVRTVKRKCNGDTRQQTERADCDREVVKKDSDFDHAVG